MKHLLLTLILLLIPSCADDGDPIECPKGEVAFGGICYIDCRQIIPRPIHGAPDCPEEGYTCRVVEELDNGVDGFICLPDCAPTSTPEECQP